MIGRFSLLIVPAVSLYTPGCPLASCCPPEGPLQLAFIPHSPGFPHSLALESIATSCLPLCTSVLFLCFSLPPPSQIHVTFLSLGRVSATLSDPRHLPVPW